MLTLPGAIYRPAVGAALWFVAYRRVRSSPGPVPTRDTLPVGAALLCGVGIALTFESTGVGGIFLGPLLLLPG